MNQSRTVSTLSLCADTSVQQFQPSNTVVDTGNLYQRTHGAVAPVFHSATAPIHRRSAPVHLQKNRRVPQAHTLQVVRWHRQRHLFRECHGQPPPLPAKDHGRPESHSRRPTSRSAQWPVSPFVVVVSHQLRVKLPQPLPAKACILTQRRASRARHHPSAHQRVTTALPQHRPDLDVPRGHARHTARHRRTLRPAYCLAGCTPAEPTSSSADTGQSTRRASATQLRPAAAIKTAMQTRLGDDADEVHQILG